MNKGISVSKKIVFLLLLLVALPTYSSLIRPGYFPMHDDMQTMRLFELDKCISDKQIPCRWVPDMGYGYGYPQFNYYAPLPYYIMESFHLLGLGFLDSVKLGFISSSLVSLGGMFLLGSTLWGMAGGFIASFLYAYAPYRAFDFYVRGAMGELWALSFLPFVFLGLTEIIRGKKKAILLFAISLASLFMSHNITALISLPFLIAWGVLLLFFQKKVTLAQLKENIIKILLGFLWGFGLASFFILPAWFEKNLVHVETLLTGYFNYINHFLGINQILFQTQWGYGTSEVGPWDDALLSVGPIHWIIPIVVLPLLIFLKSKKFKVLLALVLMGWIALFMTHPKSMFIWKSIPILAFLQFPWRFLLFATFFFSLASGSMALLHKGRNMLKVFWLGIILIFVYLLNRNYFRPRIWINITDNEKFSGKLWQNQQTISIFDYLPIFAEKPPGERAPDKPVILKGKGEVVAGDKKSNYQTWEIDVESDDAKIQLPLFYFPGWKVYVNGKETQIYFDNPLGLITFNIDQGKNAVKAKLTDTPIRSFSNIISLSALILIPLYLKKMRVQK